LIDLCRRRRFWWFAFIIGFLKTTRIINNF
jgi:hypothetical protein